MKDSSRSQNNNLQSKKIISHTPRPEIRDNLEHSEGEEPMDKGDDSTHNEKQTKEKQKKKKKNK